MEKLEPKPSKFEDPNFLDEFRALFAGYIENMITDPKHTNSILVVALGKDYQTIPEDIIKGGKKYDINSWVGDAFPQVMREAGVFNEDDRNKLHDIFFFNKFEYAITTEKENF